MKMKKRFMTASKDAATGSCRYDQKVEKAEIANGANICKMPAEGCKWSKYL